MNHRSSSRGRRVFGTRALVGPASARIAIAIVAIAFMAGDASASGGTVARDLLSEANIQLAGAAAGDNAGLRVAGAGDVNGDGVPDLLIGAPKASYSGRSGSGAAYVVFSQPDMASVDLGSLGSDGYVVGGAAAFDDTGVVANAGDVNGDGVPDAVVGAPGSFGGGAAYVVFGKATSAAIDLASLGTNGFRISGGDGRVGAAVAGAGDLNGDSKADVVIGAPDATKPGGCCFNYGAAFVVFGKTDTSAVDLTSLGSSGYRIDGASFGDHAGGAVSSAGDVDGDGMGDVLVSAPDAPYPPAARAYSGKVYVVFGKADGTTIDLASLGAGGYEIDGPSQQAFAGNAVADAGDVNGDGTPDQLIGDQFINDAYVVFGQSDALTTIDLAALGTQGYLIDGVDQGFGSSLASLGDVNGDGIPDAVIGAVGASNNGDTSGSTYVLYLHDAASPINLFNLGADGYRLDGGAAHDDAGISVADAGDVNGDGADDPLVGAPFADPSSRAEAGVAYVAFFRPPNDDLADAQDILGSLGIVDGTTVGATKETGEPDHAGDPGGSSIWYRWTAPASGRVEFATFGSDFDTVLAAYTGSAVNALTEVASNDDANGLPTSEIGFAVVQGTTYSVAIDGAGGDNGPSQLFWILHPPNDDFAAAQLLAGDHGSVNGSSVGATKEPSEPDHAGDVGGASVWYRWTAPATGTLTVDTCNSNFDTLLAVYTGADAAHLIAVASNDDGAPACGLGSQVAFSVNGGTTYDIAVDGFDGDWGEFVLAWTRTNPPPPPPQPPTNTAIPTITGTPKPGQTLAAARGTWSGTAPIAFGYQWESCDRAGASCVAVRARTTSTYVVSSSDAGSSLRVLVTASNAAGSASATSAPTGVVPAPARCVVPRLKGKTLPKARSLLRRAHCALGRVSYARSSLRRGLIVSQRPRAGAFRPRGTKVRVVVSRGRRR